MRIEYPVKTYLIYLSNEDCYQIYAMDTQDAVTTLLEQEKSVKLADVTLIEEHQCARKTDNIH